MLDVLCQSLPQISITELTSVPMFNPRSSHLPAVPHHHTSQTLLPDSLRCVHGRRQSRVATHVFRWDPFTRSRQLSLSEPKSRLFSVQLHREDGGFHAHAGVQVVDCGGLCGGGNHQSIQMIFLLHALRPILINKWPQPIDQLWHYSWPPALPS